MSNTQDKSLYGVGIARHAAVHPAIPPVVIRYPHAEAYKAEAAGESPSITTDPAVHPQVEITPQTVPQTAERAGPPSTPGRVAIVARTKPGAANLFALFRTF